MTGIGIGIGIGYLYADALATTATAANVVNVARATPSRSRMTRRMWAGSRSVGWGASLAVCFRAWVDGKGGKDEEMCIYMGNVPMASGQYITERGHSPHWQPTHIVMWM